MAAVLAFLADGSALPKLSVDKGAYTVPSFGGCEIKSHTTLLDWLIVDY
jgi:hypothetical protein